jgi:hypothetical protein
MSEKGNKEGIIKVPGYYGKSPDFSKMKSGTVQLYWL